MFNFKYLRDLKNGVSKCNFHGIKHANLRLCRVYPAGVIWKSRQLTANISTFYTSNSVG